MRSMSVVNHYECYAHHAYDKVVDECLEAASIGPVHQGVARALPVLLPERKGV